MGTLINYLIMLRRSGSRNRKTNKNVDDDVVPEPQRPESGYSSRAPTPPGASDNSNSPKKMKESGSSDSDVKSETLEDPGSPEQLLEEGRDVRGQIKRKVAEVDEGKDEKEFGDIFADVPTGQEISVAGIKEEE